MKTTWGDKLTDLAGTGVGNGRALASSSNDDASGARTGLREMAAAQAGGASPTPQSATASNRTIGLEPTDDDSCHIAVLDRAGVIVWVNDAWRRFADQNGFGDPAQGVGWNYLAVCGFVAGDDGGDAVANGIQAVMEGRRQIFTTEYTCHAPHERYWFQLIATPAAEGGVQIAHVPITARKEAQEELRAQQAYSETILTNMVDGLIVIDVDGIVRSFNAAAEGVFGYAAEEVVGQNVTMLMGEADRVHHDGYLAASIEAGRSAILGKGPREIVGRHKNGSDVFLELAVGRTDTEQGTFFVGSLRDITERKKAAQALEESEARFRAIAEATPTPTAITRNSDGVVLYANRAAEQAARERYGRALTDTRAQDYWADPDEHQAFLRDAMKPGGVHNREIRLWRPDGSNDWLLASAQEIVFDGEPAIFTGYQFVTEQKQAEEALRQSEARFQDFAAATADWFWEIDADNRYAFVSTGIEDGVGVLNDWYIGRSADEVIDKYYDRADWQPYFEAFAACRPYRDMILRRTGEDGRRQWIRSSGVPVFDADGTFKGFRGTASDVTERVQAQEALKQSEAWQRGIIDNWPWLLTLKDLEGRYLVVNEAYARSRDIESHDAIGKTCKEIETPEQAAVVEAHDQEVIESLTAVTHERETLLPDGTRAWRAVMKFPVLDVQGDLMGVGTFSTDVTERKRAEAALRESEQRFQDFASISADWYFETDAELRNTYFSEGLSRHVQSPEDLLGKSRFDLLGTTSDSEDEQLRAMQAREPYRNIERRSDIDDGRWLRVSGKPIFSDDGTFVGYRGAATDITDRKNAERAREVLRNQLLALFNAVPANLSLKDAEGRYLLANENLAKDYDLSVGDLTGKTIAELFDNGVARTIDRMTRQVIETGEPVFSFENQDPDLAHGKSLVTNIAPVFGEAGEVTGVVTVALDITELKETEAALRERQAMLDAVVENVPLSLSLKDREGRFTLVNPGFERLHDVSAAEVLGKTFFDILPLEVAADAAAEDRKVLESGQPLRTDYSWPAHLGLKRDELIFKFPLRPCVDGPITGVGVVALDVTDFKRAEEAQARFLNAIENLSEGLALYDEEDRLVICNQQYREMFGSARRALVPGVRFEELLWTMVEKGLVPEAQEDPAAWIAARMALHRRPPGDGETFQIERGGRQYLIRNDRLLDQSVMISAQDVTERNRQRRELEESHELLQSLMDSMPDFIAVKDTQGRYIYVNRVFEDWYATTKETALGKRLRDYMPAELEDVEAATDLQAAEAGSALSREAFYTFPDGVSRAVDVIRFPVFDRSDNVVARGVVCVDITERKQTEATRDRFLNAIESLSEGIAVFDTEDRFVVCNEQYRRLSGANLETLVPGNAFEDILRVSIETEGYPEAVDDPEAWLAVRMERHRSPYGTFELDRYGRRILVQENRLPDGGWVIAVLDVTDQRQQEEQLRQAQKMESVGQLTGGVAHDFNNLMAIIQGNIRYLDKQLAPESELRNLTAPALRAVKRGASLTHRLLAFSRKQALVAETVDVEKLVVENGELLRRSLGEDISIEIVPAPDLWICEVDPGQLEQAVVNLATNARDAMPDGGSLVIEASNETVLPGHHQRQLEVDAGDYVVISVTDDGEGISPEARDKIFDPFYTTKALGKGTGLGLSMVYGFAKQSGGGVTVESEVGEGTTFKLYLPRSLEGVTDGEAPDVGPAATANGETILVVEDDADLRSLATVLLEDLGYRVLVAADGPAALELLEGEVDIDLLLTDVVLPEGMDGKQVADAVRAKLPKVKVLYMSGYAEGTIVRRGGLGRGVQLMQKPFDLDDLASQVRLAIDA